MRNNKNFDLIIISILVIAVIFFINYLFDDLSFFKILIKGIIFITILLFFLYEKTKNLKPHLYLSVQKYYPTVESSFKAIFNFIGNFAKPTKIGNNVQLDTSQFVFLFIMLLLLIL